MDPSGGWATKKMIREGEKEERREKTAPQSKAHTHAYNEEIHKEVYH